MATATPVQVHPIEAWDLLDALSRGNDAVLGTPFSRWRDADRALDLVMGRARLPDDEIEMWEWVRSPLPPKDEHRDFEALRSIGYAEALHVIDGDWEPQEAVERTKTATHRLIRMQVTWFSDDDARIEWVDGADALAAVAAGEAAAGTPVP